MGNVFSFTQKEVSPHLRKSKTVFDSGFHAVVSGFRVPDSSLYPWNLDSGSQSQGFRIPPVKTSRNPESGIRIPDSLTWGEPFHAGLRLR